MKRSLIFQSCPLDTTVRVDHLMYEGILHPMVKLLSPIVLLVKKYLNEYVDKL